MHFITFPDGEAQPPDRREGAEVLREVGDDERRLGRVRPPPLVDVLGGVLLRQHVLVHLLGGGAGGVVPAVWIYSAARWLRASASPS